MTRSDEHTVFADRYELGEVLGVGGMGTVRDAMDRRLGRAVAVKVLRTDLADQPGPRRRFEAEARAAARLAHPNVVTVFDSGEDDGVPFLVMERLPGRTFADELADGPVLLDRVGLVGAEMLAALAAAHDAGIVHRDIKPGNVLLTTDGHVKVSDFGIAKTLDDADATQTAELVATVRYLAPERLAGAPATPRSDLYSVGVVLYEALSGRCPFAGDTPVAIMRAVERGDVPAPAEAPPDVGAVVQRAMSRDPDERYESAAAMAAALAGTGDIDATTPAPSADIDTEPVAPLPTMPPTRVLPPRPEQETRTPSRRLVFGLAIAVAALLVGGLALGHRNSGTPAPKQTTTSSQPPTTSQTAPTSVPPGLDNAIRQLEQAVRS